MYKAVIFDFEGTLVNVAWDVDRALAEVREFLREMNNELEFAHYAEIYNLISKSREELIKEIDEIYDRYDEMALNSWRLKEDVLYLLERLEKLGIKRALVTSIGKRSLEKALTKFKIYDKFSVVVTRDDVRFLKPEPEGILKAIEKLGVGRNSILYIGDSVSDVRAALKAGVDVVALQGESSREELEDAGSKYVLESPSDILEIIGLANSSQ